MDTNILLFQKPEKSDKPVYIPLNIKDNSIGILNVESGFNKETDIYHYFENNKLNFNQSILDASCFTFGDKTAMDLKLKFEKEKIVWQRVTQQFKFNIIPERMYILDSMAFLTGHNLYYIIGCLNSKLIDFYIKSYVHQYADAGFLLSNQYVERITIPKIPEKEQQPIIDLVDKILQVKAKNPDADTKDFGKEIDELVYKLYNLTEDEINLINSDSI